MCIAILGLLVFGRIHLNSAGSSACYTRKQEENGELEQLDKTEQRHAEKQVQMAA